VWTALRKTPEFVQCNDSFAPPELVHLLFVTHGLRRGLHSGAALRLIFGGPFHFSQTSLPVAPTRASPPVAPKHNSYEEAPHPLSLGEQRTLHPLPR